MPIVADAAVKIGADLSQFNRDLRTADRPVQALGARIKGVFSPQNLAMGAAAVGGLVVAGLAGAVKSLIDIERLNAQTDAAIRSTGGAAKVSREEIEELAEGMESLTTIERETVQEAANMLLTFTKVRNEVGEGNDIFNQATEAALNMSVALGTDATSSAMMLGKALNDPVRGMQAMSRAGIQFTDQQKDMVKQMVEAGDVLGAQKIILAEMETQFGGSAEAFANTTAGRIQRFQNDVGNMFESIVVGATKVADFFDDQFVQPVEQGIDTVAIRFGDQAARIDRIAEGTGRSFDELSAWILLEMQETGDAFEDVADRASLEFGRLPEDAKNAGEGAMLMLPDAIRRGGPVVAKEAGKIAGMLPSEIQRRVEDVRRAGMDSVVAFAAGILEKQNDPLLAMEALTRANEEALTRGEEIARLKGQLTSSELAAGLNDIRPEVRLAAQAARAEIVDRLSTLGVEAYGWGSGLGWEMHNGIMSVVPVVRTASGELANAVRGQIGIKSEPPDPSSPLRGITKWGGNIVKTIAEGIYGNIGFGQRAAGVLAGSLVPQLGVPTVGAIAGTGGGGVTYQLVVNGVDRAFRNRTDFINALDDLTVFGDGRV